MMNKKILRIAIPSIISNITIPLLGLVDTAITGHLGETAYIGAIALGTLFFNIIYWNFGFLRMGTSGLTAQAFGRKDDQQITRTLTQAVVVGLSSAVVVLVLQYPVERLAFYFLEPTPGIEKYALQYIRILIWGAPAVLVLYAFYGWFIGMQNAPYQMYVAISMNVFNVLLSVLFVYGLGMRIEGVALSTLIAQYFGAFLAFLLWNYKYGKLKKLISVKESLQLSVMKKFFAVNRDIFLRTLCLIAVTFFFVSAGTRQGEVTLAVNTLMMQLFTLFSFFMDGFAYAGEALAGEAAGSHDKTGLRKVTRYLLYWGLGLGVLFTVLYAVGGEVFLRFLTNDQAVISASGEYFYWAILIPLAGFAAFIWDGILIGVTQTRYMLIGVGGAAMAFFAVYYVFGGTSNNHVLWFAFILYLFLRGAIQMAYGRRLVRG